MLCLFRTGRQWRDRGSIFECLNIEYIACQNVGYETAVSFSAKSFLSRQRCLFYSNEYLYTFSLKTEWLLNILSYWVFFCVQYSTRSNSNESLISLRAQGRNFQVQVLVRDTILRKDVFTDLWGNIDVNIEAGSGIFCHKSQPTLRCEWFIHLLLKCLVTRNLEA